MGTGLEMRLRTTGLLIGAAMLSVLAGCSNNPAPLDLRGLARDALQNMSGQAPAAAPLAAPEAVLAATEASVIVMETARGDRLYLLGLRDNGPYRTYVTATRQTLTLRDGMITGTRGLGQDMMASDSAEVTALLRKGRPGQASRRLEVLDGDDRTRVIVLDCVIAKGGTGLTPLATPLPAGRPMTETCTGSQGDAAGLRFTNHYLIDRAGRIILSRQWLPSLTGPVDLQILRD